MRETKWGVVPLSLAAAILAAACSSSNKSSPSGVGPDAAPADAGRGAGVYVTNSMGATVTIFALGASGNAVPVRTLEGSTTGLQGPMGIGVDSFGNVYVANRSGGTVTVYGPTDEGDVSPVRTITATGMLSPEGIAVGPAGDLYVSACPGCGVNNGDTGIYHFPSRVSQPDRVIGGASNVNTGLTAPASIALDANQNLVVGNSFGGTIETFGPGANGDVAPLRSFTPSSSNLQGIAVALGTIFVADPATGIQEYATSDTASDAGSVQPSFTIANYDFPIQYPAELAVDTSAAPAVLYAVDFTGDTVFVAPTSGAVPNLSVMSVTAIEGAATTLNAPVGIAVVH